MQPTTPKIPRSRRPIQKVRVDKWTEDGDFKMTAKVLTVPRLSGSGKCYIYSFEHGETDISVNIDGIDRKVRMTFMLYVKVPASERRRTLEEEAKRAEAAGEPKLY